MESEHTHIILINQLSLMASIGILETERATKQSLLISLEIKVKTPEAVNSGKIEDAVCYGVIVDKIKGLVDSQHFDLLETLAQDIVNKCLSDDRILFYKITLEKPDIIKECQSVGIQIEGSR